MRRRRRVYPGTRVHAGTPPTVTRPRYTLRGSAIGRWGGDRTRGGGENPVVLSFTVRAFCYFRFRIGARAPNAPSFAIEKSPTTARARHRQQYTHTHTHVGRKQAGKHGRWSTMDVRLVAIILCHGKCRHNEPVGRGWNRPACEHSKRVASTRFAAGRNRKRLKPPSVFARVPNGSEHVARYENTLNSLYVLFLNRRAEEAPRR